ncbi:hypothetical protein BGZ46_004905 [Entomortierella lignicola]|nr:hypothetical protein BGZ46_004905 [Entomortierella lignicola]
MFCPESVPEHTGFSGGWLRNFKKNSGINEYAGHGRSDSVDLEQHQDRIKEIKKLLALFIPEGGAPGHCGSEIGELSIITVLEKH